jgi:hypothetical protein
MHYAIPLALAILGYLFARKSSGAAWFENLRLVVFFASLAIAIVSGVWSPTWWDGVTGGGAVFLGMLLGAVAQSAHKDGDCGCGNKHDKH